MKVRQILLAAGLVALSVTTFAQPERDHRERRDERPPTPPVVQPQQPLQPNRDHRDVLLNPQPLPPEPPDRYRDRDHRRDRDFRIDRDHRSWGDHDHRRNYERHREHRNQLRIGMSKERVLRMEWWAHPLFIRDGRRTDEYVYADGRFGICTLTFRHDRLTEINC